MNFSFLLSDELFHLFRRYTKIKKMKRFPKKISGLSLRWDGEFIKNIVIVIGVVAVWRGIWDLLDMYLFPQNQLLSDGVSIILGIFLLYLPDGSFHQLGDYIKTKK